MATQWNKNTRKYKEFLLQESLWKILTENWKPLVLDQWINTEWSERTPV